MIEDDGSAPISRRRHIVRLVVFGAFLLTMFYLIGVERVIDMDAVHRAVADTGPLAPLAYVGAAAILGSMFVPGSLLAAGSGLLFGPLVGLFVTLGSSVGTAIVTSRIGQRAGRDSAKALLGPKRSERVDALIDKSGLWAVVGQRFIPGVSDALACYTFGAFGVPLWQIAVGSFIGSFPRAFVYTTLGATVREGSSALTYIAIAVWCITAVVGVFAARRGYQHWREHGSHADDRAESDPGDRDDD
ncbi:TVP38/TMEM64 family protein [Mycobacterium asiaticum]|uniref:TVP38/TMEM64 family protein n=1 Tax=Mycobacterium asiaticum TaxID=1790 RepID=UPI000B215257